MPDASKPPAFVSLQWKTLITAGSLSVLILSLLIWHFNARYQQGFDRILEGLRQANIEALERSIYGSGEEWQNRLNQTVSTIISVAGQHSTESDSLQNLASELNDAWFTFSDQAGASHLLLFDSHLDIKQTWGSSPLIASSIENLTRLLDDQTSSSSRLICLDQCQQIVFKVIYQNNNRLAVVMLVRPFDHLASQYKTAYSTYLGIAEFTSIDLSNISNEATPINYWQPALLPSRKDTDFIGIFTQPGQTYNRTELSENYKKINIDGSHFAIGILPIRNINRPTVNFLLATDISNVQESIVNKLIQDSLVIIFFLSTLGAYITFTTWRYLRRIKQQLQVLPMLGQRQYREVRNIISQNRNCHFYQDEFDKLDGSVTDLSYQLQSLEKAVSHRTREMERLSLFDTLTGLANRNLFLYELQQDVQRFREQGGMLAIVILDIDKFKRINDNLGHQLGDMLISKIGLRLRTATRSLGLVSRLGGDEFALILRSVKNFDQIEVLCQKILDLMHKPISLNNHNIVTSCSLGISLAGSDQNENDLVKNAEIAMYKAKENGGNNFMVFNAAMATAAHENLSLEIEIRRAFENNEFTLFLQPKVNMDSEIEGFESLVRWDHPDRGILPPSEFIPIMENIGVISQLDDFVLDSSCRQLKVLNQHFPDINIAVNISSTHFTDKDFLGYLKKCLKQYPIEPKCLELEITETLLMENMKVGMNVIQQIKDLGVSIAIDDFGTGYSSLSYLKRLPVDTIKIDREFIKDIPDSESDMQISSVIIFLAKQLNFKVVAEGVETPEQMTFLKANQCDLAQGFLFSKPVPAHKAMIMLESQRGDNNKKYAG